MKQFNKLLQPTLFLLMVIFGYSAASAQAVTLPRTSQQSTVSQRIGVTDITIVYHSPAVNERKIWGGLVPFDAVWRAGANDNTVITFSDDVTVEGTKLAAGSYGLFMLPKEKSVDIIFSSESNNWGTKIPTPEETVATVTVTPQTAPHREWLSYDFLDRGGNSTTAALSWEKWLIPFKIEVDVPNTVVNNIRKELKASKGYLGKEQAARYCLNNDLALDEALVWIDESIAAEKRFSNLVVKSDLLSKKGDAAAAKKLKEEAYTLATPEQLNNYGYQLLGRGDTDGALAVFLQNIDTAPKTHVFYWGFVDSVGEAYLKKGDDKKALKYYKQAKEYAPESNQKYLDNVISGIKTK